MIWNVPCFRSNNTESSNYTICRIQLTLLVDSTYPNLHYLNTFSVTFSLDDSSSWINIYFDTLQAFHSQQPPSLSNISAQKYRIMFHSNDASSVGCIIILFEHKENENKSSRIQRGGQWLSFQTINRVCDRYIFALPFIDLTIILLRFFDPRFLSYLVFHVQWYKLAVQRNRKHTFLHLFLLTLVKINLTPLKSSLAGFPIGNNECLLPFRWFCFITS